MTAPRRGTYEVRGLQLAYHAYGAPADPLVLLLHGFLDHGLSFAPVAEALAARGHHAVAVDFRGHGCSGWVGAGGDYHFPDYFHDTITLLEQFGAERVSLVGHSMGGSVATGVAALLPEHIEAVVLLEGMGPPAEAASEAVSRLRQWHAATSRRQARGARDARSRARNVMPDLEAAAERLRRKNPRVSPERARALALTFSEPAPSGDGLVWRFDPLHLAPAARRFDIEEAKSVWRAIRAPVLSLFGGESDFVYGDLAERHACISDLRIARVESAGHNIHHDRPEVVAQAVLQWLGGDRSGPLPQGITELPR